MRKPILIDVSRLVWRLWRGGLPTGVDRVCLAYVEHFGGRGQAVLQRKGRYLVLDRKSSERLFALLQAPSDGFRARFLRFAAGALRKARGHPGVPDLIYLNVGHTGLDDPALSSWIERTRVRPVFLIHDLIPLLRPEYCRAGEQAKHERRIRNALRNAAGVIGNSQATIEELRTFAGARGLPMPPTIAAWIAGPPAPAGVTPKRFDRPHFITIGTIEGRKNHTLLLHIWKRLVEAHGADVPLLIIVGQRGWEAGEAIATLDRAADLKGHVIELGKCGDDELAALTAGARALLMPSIAEGFGLPVAEALQIGTPVIASDLVVFREFAGDIPTYIDPLDGTRWEETIVSFMKDSDERERQLLAMKGYRAPDWREHFKSVEDWLATFS